MTITEFTQAAGAVIGLIILIGAALALVRGSYSKARIQALREDNDEFRKRLDDADKESRRQKDREERLEAKVARQESEISLLTALVTQRADVETVLAELRALQSRAEDRWALMLDALEKLVEER